MNAILLELCCAPSASDDGDIARWSRRHGTQYDAAHMHGHGLDPARENEHDDRLLLQRMHAGDATAFDALVDRYFDKLTRVAYGIIGVRDAAEDAAQDVLVRVWELGRAWEPAGTVAAYLFRAARNTALNMAGRTRRYGQTILSLESPDDAIAPAADAAVLLDERVTLLRAVIATLPERRRTALRLRYEEGLTYPDIAEVMEMSVKSAEQLVALTIKTLRKALGRKLG